MRQSLGRTHLVTAITSACVTLTALLVMGFYADHNLDLVARAISYTTKAAVVFQDEEAAGEALRAIAERDEVAEARIYLPDGKLLTSWSRTMNTTIAELEAYLIQLILPGSVREPMLRVSEKIGEVELFGYGESLLIFLIAVMLICLLLSAMGAFYVARRM